MRELAQELKAYEHHHQGEAHLVDPAMGLSVHQQIFHIDTPADGLISFHLFW